MRQHWKIVYHEAQQFNHFSPNYEENNFNPNEFRLNVQIHSDRSENIALSPSADLKFSVSIDSNRRDVNRDYIVEYVSDLKGFRIKVETAQRGLEPVLRGFGGGGYAGDGGALSADVLKSGAVLDCQVSDWGQWSECNASCGTGIMTRTRKILQSPQNGGKHCPTLMQKRGCQGYRCHGHHDKKILRETALLLPAALSYSRHANDSHDIRRNLRLRYHDSYKHNRELEYCVEFEVLKSSKTCHKLPPYNLMIEGDRITVRCDLEAFVYDNSRSNSVKNDTHKSQTHLGTNLEFMQNSQQQNLDDDNDSLEENDEEEDDENMIDGSSSDQEQQQDDYDSLTLKRKIRTTTSTTTTTTTTIAPALLNTPPNYHCRGEGLPGRTTRWSALAAPSCRGKWLRLTLRTPKKCTHAQFIYV